MSLCTVSFAVTVTVSFILIMRIIIVIIIIIVVICSMSSVNFRLNQKSNQSILLLFLLLLSYFYGYYVVSLSIVHNNYKLQTALFNWKHMYVCVRVLYSSYYLCLIFKQNTNLTNSEWSVRFRSVDSDIFYCSLFCFITIS